MACDGSSGLWSQLVICDFEVIENYPVLRTRPACIFYSIPATGFLRRSHDSKLLSHDRAGPTQTRGPSRKYRLHGHTSTRPDINETTVPAVPSVDKAEIKTVPVGDITIAWKEAGSCTPLILIVGSAVTMDMWDTRMVNQLAQQYRVIVFDNRGMGPQPPSFASRQVLLVVIFCVDSIPDIPNDPQNEVFLK